VFIESAWFDPAITRVTGRETGIDSDAKYRFERGVDPESVMDGLELATALILEYGGGEPSEVRVAGKAPARLPAIELDIARVKKLLGLDLPPQRIEAILTALGFKVTRGPVWTVAPPSWRRDCREAADLIEEIARIEGYDKLPATRLSRPEGRLEAPATPLQNRVRAARRAVAQRGYQEAVTWSFCHHAQAALFGGAVPGLRLANPISSELDVMRPSALIHLITALEANARRGLPDPRFFEAGPVYLNDQPDGQRTVVAAARRVIASRDWRGGDAPDVLISKLMSWPRSSPPKRRWTICRSRPMRATGGIRDGRAFCALAAISSPSSARFIRASSKPSILRAASSRSRSCWTRSRRRARRR